MRHNLKNAGMLFFLAAVMSALLAFAWPAPKATAESSLCQADAVIMGLRGSGQTAVDDIPGYPNFGAQTGSVAIDLEGYLEQGGYNVLSIDIDYSAVGAYTSHLPLFGETYVESVLGGVALLVDALQTLDNCNQGPQLVSLIGYSQGTDVIKTALWKLEDNGVDFSHLIGSIVLIADPHFDPNEPIALLGSFDQDDGLLDAWPLPARYQHSTVSICVENDWVCSPSWNENDSTDAHKNAYFGRLVEDAAVYANVLMDPILDTRFAYRYDIVKWVSDPVTSWYVDDMGFRHWIPDAATWGCLVDGGAKVNSLSSTTLTRLPDIIGDHATCTSSGGDGGNSPPVSSGYRLPYPEGISHIVTQAPGGNYSHPCPGNSCQAIDFAMSLNDSVMASKTGSVRSFSENGSWNGGLGNYVMIEHTDGWCSLYSHLNSVSNSISVGTQAIQGQVIGGAGDTGLATGVHLHFAVVGCGSWQSVDVDFVEVADPIVGNSYTSQNISPIAAGIGLTTRERNHHHFVMNFDSDPKTDVIRSTQNAFYAVYNGQGVWKQLVGGTNLPPVEQLAFGDFDCNGRTDILRLNGSQWKVVYNGWGVWQTLNYGSSSVDNIALGDFNGDGCTDVFRATGSEWQVAWSGQGPWQYLNTDSSNINQLRFADLNGDGKTDVVRGFVLAGLDKYKVAWSGQGPWQLRTIIAPTIGQLGFCDFDGNGTDDLFYADGVSWRYLRGGTGGWVTVNPDAKKRIGELAFGDFDGNGKCDVFHANNSTWQVVYDGWGTWQTMLSEFTGHEYLAAAG